MWNIQLHHLVTCSASIASQLTCGSWGILFQTQSCVSVILLECCVSVILLECCVSVLLLECCVSVILLESCVSVLLLECCVSVILLECCVSVILLECCVSVILLECWRTIYVMYASLLNSVIFYFQHFILYCYSPVLFISVLCKYLSDICIRS